MKSTRSNPDFLNGVPEMLILHLLSECPSHGYGLVQAIRRSTGGTLEFGEGCVYPILHRLEAEGFVTGRRESVAGRSRVVYRVTPKGERRLTETMGAWHRVVGAVGNVLQGGEHGRPALA